MARRLPLLFALAALAGLSALAPAAPPPQQLRVAREPVPGFGPPTEIVLPPDELQPRGAVTQAEEGDEQYDYSVTLLRANIAHAGKLTGKGVTVGVLDTGIDPDHHEFRGRIKWARDFTGSRFGSRDVQNHGTHCAGSIAAARDGKGTIGVAPECTLVIAKVLGDTGSGGSDGIRAGGLAAMEQGADILSLSLGGGGPDDYQRDLCKRAEAAGVILIVASGNDGAADGISYPALYPECISVGAIDAQLRRARFSNGGKSLWCVGPGVNVKSCLPGNKYGVMSGTSMATPNVAGVAALWVESHPNVPKKDRPNEWRKWLSQVRRDIPPPGRDTGTGYGLPDAARLLEDLIPDRPAPPVSPPVAPPVPNPLPYYDVTITDADLTPEAKARLGNAGIAQFAFALAAKPPAPKPPATQPAPAPKPAPPVAAPAPAYPAPEGDGWSWVGDHWERPMPATRTPATAFAPPLRFGGGCAGGNCPLR